MQSNNKKDFVVMGYLEQIKKARAEIRRLRKDIIINYAVIGKCSHRTRELIKAELKRYGKKIS